jgi:hypothetical protein
MRKWIIRPVKPACAQAGYSVTVVRLFLSIVLLALCFGCAGGQQSTKKDPVVLEKQPPPVETIKAETPAKKPPVRHDVGLLTKLDGKVEIVAGKKRKQPATAYRKVALGDRLLLGKDARVQIAYFETSRHEAWKGKGEVDIREGEGRSSGLRPDVRKLPPLVARQLVKTPASGEHVKIGMVTVRSLSSDTIESLEKQYREYRAAAAPEDTTPEVFLLTGLLEMQEYEHAQAALEGLRGKLSATPALADVIAHFDPLVKEAMAGK